MFFPMPPLGRGLKTLKSYSDEYDWLIPDLTQNTQGQLYPNIPSGFN